MHLKSIAFPDKPAYLIVYASKVNGVSWCPDCQIVETFVNKKFEGMEDRAVIVEAGVASVWRNANNEWRKGPWFVEKLPTIVKVTGEDENKWERLVEEDAYNQKKLDAFVEST